MWNEHAENPFVTPSSGSDEDNFQVSVKGQEVLPRLYRIIPWILLLSAQITSFLAIR